jgi:hypothetical protein
MDMSYTCPDCGEMLTGSARELEIELEDGESLQLLDGKRVVVTSAVCSNGCSAEAEEKPKRKKRKPATSGEACGRSEECSKPNGHLGRCNRKRAEELAST